jgi:hypothetical protein
MIVVSLYCEQSNLRFNPTAQASHSLAGESIVE